MQVQEFFMAINLQHQIVVLILTQTKLTFWMKGGGGPPFPRSRASSSFLVGDPLKTYSTMSTPKAPCSANNNTYNNNKL